MDPDKTIPQRFDPITNKLTSEDLEFLKKQSPHFLIGLTKILLALKNNHDDNRGEDKEYKLKQLMVKRLVEAINKLVDKNIQLSPDDMEHITQQYSLNQLVIFTYSLFAQNPPTEIEG